MAHAMDTLSSDRKAQPDVKNYHLIWLAHNIDKLKEDFSQSFNNVQTITKSMETFNSVDIFIDYLFENNHKKVILLLSGALGENTVPIIHDALHLDSIFVFCINRIHHEKWAKDWTKVAGVFDNIDTMCEAVKQMLQKQKPIRSRLSPIEIDPPIIEHRSVTPELPRQDNHRDKPIVTDDQKRRSKQKHSHRHDHSQEFIRTKDDMTTTNSLTSSKDKETKITPSHQPSDNNEDRIISLVNSCIPAKQDTSDSQSLFSSNLDQLRDTLITITERKLGETLLHNRDGHGATSSNRDTVDRFQHTLMETIGHRVPSKSNDINELNKMFADLKQSLIDTLVQQQPLLLQELIKQTVEDAIKGQQSSSISLQSKTSDSSISRRTITLATVCEVKIMADSQKTRIDAAFRQQRDAVVANKSFRDTVRQWSTVTSMDDLASNIKKYGSNDLEYAWLLFCWIGQNIKYALHCNINAAETVFRTRQGVCRGFASLYHECCTLLGIQCFEISGFSKNNFVRSFEELKNSPHAWNSIVLDKHTYLVDPTWGAGGRDNETILEDFYFLTSPEEFIYSHFCTGTQLLNPEITINEFLSLPVMKSNYYQFGLNLLSPKQGFNEIKDNLFKISVRTPKHIELSASLKIGNEQYPRNLHTLCQRDENNSDIYNCFIAPPVDGLYDIDIYAKTHQETSYQGVINMRLRVSNIMNSLTFPITYLTFSEHNCILIEPLQRLIYKNEEILIHMIIPHANVIKIDNNDHQMVPDKDEYKNGILKKKIFVQGDVKICGRWDANADTISIICTFHMA